MIEKICREIINFIKQNVENIDQEKEEIVKYGLEIFIYEILMFILILSLAFILKIVNYILIAIISYSVIRGLANGAHAKTRIQCAAVYIVTIFAIVYLCIYVFKTYNIFFISAILIINILVLYLYAPGDTEENPNYRYKRRVIQKILSILVIILLFITSYINKITYPQISNIIVLVSTFGVFLTTPLAYKMLSCKRSTRV